MPFIDTKAWRLALCGLLGSLMAACSSNRPAPSTSPTPPSATPSASVAAGGKLGSPAAARSWDEFKKQAALRMVAANPGLTYTGEVPEMCLAIPVLEIELNSDGSIRHIDVMRYPTQAKDTTQIAIDAVRRAAPFGDMRHLKKPWKYAEVFLFDDNRHFKPRTLDE